MNLCLTAFTKSCLFLEKLMVQFSTGVNLHIKNKKRPGYHWDTFRLPTDIIEMSFAEKISFYLHSIPYWQIFSILKFFGICLKTLNFSCKKKEFLRSITILSSFYLKFAALPFPNFQKFGFLIRKFNFSLKNSIFVRF